MDELCICHGAPITTDTGSVAIKRLYANAYHLLVFTESTNSCKYIRRY